LNPDEVTSEKPSTNVPGFLFLGASKIYFDLRIKQKRRELRQQFGFYAWIEQIREDLKS